MRPSDVSSALKALIPTKRPVFLWGPPGIGKSQVIKQAADSLEMQLIDIRAVLLDPVDIRGLPSIKDNRAVWCPPDFLPKGGRGVLLFDEVPQAAPLVQASLMQLTLDRRCGEYDLPPDWTIVSAGNRQEDRAGTHRLITPLLNRFIHLDMEVSHEDWMEWALNAGIQPEVRAFLAWKPSLLFAFDPTTNKRAFPTPRSWSFVSDILPHTPTDLLLPVAMGCVGEGPACEFVGFVRIYRDLPDPDEVLKNPLSGKIPREPSVLFALCGALVERMRTADMPTMGRFVQYVDRLPSEFTILAFRDAVNQEDSQKRRGRMLQAPGASQLMAKHKDVLMSSKQAS